ncbi:NACHT domain-containing protein [Streptomyces umbrinus]|uniref:NACHT domain-containing protein n=1 Tax=Streptomyces umbrinus TaxID=67370 RepID=UPI00340C5122
MSDNTFHGAAPIQAGSYSIQHNHFHGGQPASVTRPRRAERVGASLPETSPRVLAAANALADELEHQWMEEARRQRLLEPTPIPVGWSRSLRPVAGAVELAVDPSRQPRYVPPTVPTATPATLGSVENGELESLCPIYEGLASGRVVILGRSGGGKSSAAIITLLNALRNRQNMTDAEEQAQTPVPVLLSCRDWEPNRVGLIEWLTRRLAADYPRLRARERKMGTLASQLVRSGRVTLFLDGLDELDPEFQDIALEEIEGHTRLRFVLLSRTEAFAEAVKRSHHLSRALVLELSPVTSKEAADYLRRCHVVPERPDWRRLTEHVQNSPDSPVSQVLSSPLALMLLRTLSNDEAIVRRLLIPETFDSRDDVEDYLLDQYPRVACRPLPGEPPRPAAEEVDLCLRYIAHRMSQEASTTLLWQHLHRWQPWLPRVLSTGLLGMAVTSVMGSVVFGPLGQYTVRGSTGTDFGLWYGGRIGLIFGLLAAVCSELRATRADRERRDEAPRMLFFNPAATPVLTVALTVAVGNQTSYPIGVPTGIAVGGLAGAAATRPWPIPRRRQPRFRLLRPRIDPVTALVTGLAVGLAYGTTKGIANGVAAGIAGAALLGLMAGVLRPAAQGDFSSPRRQWDQDRERSLTVGLGAGTILGFALGFKNATAHGVLAGVVAGVAIGALIAAACAIGMSDLWRTNLVFLQLRLRGAVPAGGTRILWHAYERGVLRGQGPTLAFRHLRLQERMAATYRSGREEAERRLAS